MAVFSSCSRNSVKFLQPPTGFFNDYKYFLAVTIPLFLPETSFGNWKYMLFLLISFADFSGAFRAYVDLDEWVCRDWRKIFRTRFCSSFDWHLLEIWVLHCVHTLSKKSWDVQEEIFMQLKHTDYQEN